MMSGRTQMVLHCTQSAADTRAHRAEERGQARTKGQLSSLRRGLTALSLMNFHGRLTTTELARHCGIPRTTAHRILATLVAEGYVVHNRAGRSYFLSSQVRRLASGFGNDSLVAEAARPILGALCGTLMMPFGLSTPTGENMVLQVTTDFEAPLALGRVPEGTAFPISYGPSGYVYLASCSPGQRRQIIALARMSSGSFAKLQQPPMPSDEELDRIGERGYAIGIGAEPGCREGILAVPVRFRGVYIASLTMRFMNRVHPVSAILDRYLAVLKEAAAAIEAALDLRSERPLPAPANHGEHSGCDTSAGRPGDARASNVRIADESVGANALSSAVD